MELRAFLVQKIFKYVPDRLWVEFKYFTHFGRRCNLKTPKTFNEKLQWLKLYYHKKSHTRMVDKYEMKSYIEERIGKQYTIPLLGVWDQVDDINFDVLPDQFVLKTTHDCAGIVICTDKSLLNIESVKDTLRRAMKNNYYVRYREWPYKNVVPRIIAEQYMVDESGTQLKDYKVFCFNGEPYCVQVDFDRFFGHKKNLYSLNWRLLDFSFNYPAHPEIEIAKPGALDQMLEIAKELSAGEPFVRIDFYSVDGKPYVGEITFFPASGYGKFVPECYDRIFGDMIHLPEKRNEEEAGK
ncbi:MAG: glycosyl transferase [Oscillospiraceae bacterium]|nr:glycosyl transferase [Oscillospiraceae bacterium]